MESLPHTKGKWAGKRELIKLEPWQLFIYTTLFGWLSNATNLRRFREAYISVPRKSGKSLIAAGTGLIMLAFDGEVGAEVYCGATSEKQAWEVFKPARMMVLKTPELRDEFSIEPLARSLVVVADGAKFEPMIGDPGDGGSPSLAIIDEFHEHKTSTQYDTMMTGMGARDAPLMFIITTAGVISNGPCYLFQREFEQLLEGTLKNEERFGIIYHADVDDDWSDPKVLAKANPNMGVSVSKEFLISRQNDAIASASRQNIFRTKHLNQWVGAKTAFFNMQKWLKCKNQLLKVEQFKGADCMLSVDLASKSDLACVMRTFADSKTGLKHYYQFPRFYLPEERVHEDQTGKYQKWMNLGLLTVTDGDEIDFAVIRGDVEQDMLDYNVIEVPFDPWRATQLAQELTAGGATCVEYRSTIAMMSEPMKEYEAAVNNKRLHFDGNEILTWMAANTVAKQDANSNVFPRKERDENKIDGIVAGIMGIGRLMYREDTGTLDEWLANPIVG